MTSETPEKVRLTKAGYARHVARLNRRLADEMASLAEGMWNPLFCEADASVHAEALFQDLEATIAHVRPFLTDAALQQDNSDE